MGFHLLKEMDTHLGWPTAFSPVGWNGRCQKTNFRLSNLGTTLCHIHSCDMWRPNNIPHSQSDSCKEIQVNLLSKSDQNFHQDMARKPEQGLMQPFTCNRCQIAFKWIALTGMSS